MLDKSREVGKCQGITDQVTYRFYPDRIERRDQICTADSVKIKHLKLKFFTFSHQVSRTNQGMEMQEGALQRICTEGYGDGLWARTEGKEEFQTPHGAFSYEAAWERSVELKPEETLELAWTLEFAQK